MGIDSSILCLQAISSMKTHFFLLASKQLIFVHFICFLVNLCNKIKSLLSIYLSPNSTCVFEGSIRYGITGCGVFKAMIQNWKGFCMKINCSQMKLLNFENWTNGEPQQLAKIRVFMLIFSFFHYF